MANRLSSSVCFFDSCNRKIEWKTQFCYENQRPDNDFKEGHEENTLTMIWLKRFIELMSHHHMQHHWSMNYYNDSQPIYKSRSDRQEAWKKKQENYRKSLIN